MVKTLQKIYSQNLWPMKKIISSLNIFSEEIILQDLEIHYTFINEKLGGITTKTLWHKKFE